MCQNMNLSDYIFIIIFTLNTFSERNAEVKLNASHFLCISYTHVRWQVTLGCRLLVMLSLITWLQWCLPHFSIGNVLPLSFLMFKLSQIWLIRVPASWFLYHFRLSVQIKHLLPFTGTFGCSRLNLFFSCSDTGIIWFRKPFLLLPFSGKHLEKPRSYTKCAHSCSKSLVPGLFSRQDFFKYVHNDNWIHMRLSCSFHLYISLLPWGEL